ncbi:MAG: transporter substrate-binding domain-containing protein [Lachnospiraceae bacterium]|nr:transporter substrate-binding domain-containing protein [Lachnospiraceae bacterium]
MKKTERTGKRTECTDKMNATRLTIKRFSSACLLLSTVLLSVLLTGCGTRWKASPVKDPSNLEGRRVGVEIACDTDYALTGRSDLKVVRYDGLSGILLALQYDKVDVMALDELRWRFTEASHSGLRCVTPAFATSGYIIYFSSELNDVRDEFNGFLADYRSSDEYVSFQSRIAAFDGKEYTGPEIPLTGTGRVLRVAVDSSAFPRSFAEADGDVPSGFDLEALKLFANERNYRLVFTISSYDDMIYGLQGGVYDIAAGFLSDLRDAESLSTYLCVSDSLYEVPLYFIEKTQADIELIEE